MSLYEDVDLLSLDAGNTVIFLDHARVADLLWSEHHVPGSALVVAEGEAKRALFSGDSIVEVEWSHRDLPGAASWGRMIATMLSRAGIPREALIAALDRLWASHAQHNLYSKVPEGFAAAMRELRASGVKIAVVSNSEGMLDPLFAKLGILECFDAVIDSAKVGVEKPDARIFEIACERTGTTLEKTLHLGDTYATDIVGAHNANIRVAMIDPFGHYNGLYPEVPRAIGAVEVSREILRMRR